MGRIEDGFPDCRFASSRFGTAWRGAGTVLFGWFGKRTARDRDDADPMPIPERDAASERSRFQLEALEPRLLLSADPVLSELARWLADDGASERENELAAVYEEIDAATAAASGHAAEGANQESGSSSPLVIEWPEAWGSDDSGASDDADSDDAGVPAGPPATDAEDDFAAAPQAADAAVQRASERLAGDPANDPPAAVPAPAGTTHAATGGDPRAPPARGPPEGAPSPVSNDHSHLHAAGPEAGSAVAFVYAAASGRAGPSTHDEDAVGTAAGDLLAHAVALWRGAGALPAGLTLRVADLPAGALAFAHGATITVDDDAAGHGWFLDPTPRDDAEFGLPAGNDILGATSGSAAAGRVDLLSVLVHEVGHVLGLDHDAGLAVMAERLAPGTRYLLPDAALVDGVLATAAGPVSGFALVDRFDVATGLLDLSGVALAADATGLSLILEGDADLVVSGALDPADNGTLASALTVPGADPGLTRILFGDGNDSLLVQAGASIGFDLVGGAGADALINRDGGSAAFTFDASDVDGNGVPDGIETLIDRPLLFIPGFGGTGAADLAGDDLDAGDFTAWLLERGPAPERLALDPLSNAYSDLMQSLVSVGYADGTPTPLSNSAGTLHAVLWDWRVPVAPVDGVVDGLLDLGAAGTADGAADLQAIRDQTANGFDTGIHYLVHFIDEALADWTVLTAGSVAADVDVITHSTGGLLARSYVQSDVQDDLAPVHSLIQVGVPNQGTGSVFNFLLDDFSLKSTSQPLMSAFVV